MDHNRNPDVPLPGDLDEVIRRGMDKGRAALARRQRAGRLAVRSLCSLVLALGLLAGGIRLSPAFAAAVSELPVLGQLVRVFAVNQRLAEGGGGPGTQSAALTVERGGDGEQLRLDFGREDAALYRVECASCPKTITITLPGTAGVDILPELSRIRDDSPYIKSVCQLPVGGPDTAVIQLELENDADVQLQEYRGPGSLVIRLTPAGIQMDTVYSLRTLSVDGEDIARLAEAYAGGSARVLRDDRDRYFVELAQYASREEALAAAEALEDVVVERRTGNNVPVCFDSMEAYAAHCLLEEYYQLLLSSASVEPVLDFMDRHFPSAGPEERDTMLRGLTGLLEDYEEEADWARIASFYRSAGQEPPARPGGGS